MKRSGMNYAVLITITSVCMVISGCVGFPEQTDTNQYNSTTRHEEQTNRAFIEKTKITFDGGEAVIGLYDDLAGREFTAWQPIVCTMQHTSDIIQMTGLSDEVFERAPEEGLTPEAGDIALDLGTKSVILFLQDGGYSANLIPIGRIVSGIDELEAMDGSFQAYMMPAKNQGKARL